MRIAGLVLAGGRASRFGRDKAMVRLGGRPLAAWSLSALAPHVATSAVSGAPKLGRSLGLPWVADAPTGWRGPLAGVLAGLEWAGAEGCTHLATVPCDTPFLPVDLVPRLAATIGAAPLAVARADRAHPLCALWRTDATPALSEQLLASRQLSMQALAVALGGAYARFEDEAAFANINTPEDFERALARLRGSAAADLGDQTDLAGLA